MAPGAIARTGTQTLRYRGYTLRVPASWPIFHLDRASATCVRFDRHAVYLGTPSADQSCPAHVAGRTEALLVSPLRAGSAGVRGELLPAGGKRVTFAVARASVVVTATWAQRRQLVARAVGRQLAAAPINRTSVPSLRVHPAAVAHAHAHAVTYAGLGFDACTTPSTSAMSAWSASPYRAIGVYIGGVNAACSQPNLTSTWVAGQTAAGWHLILTYVGLQGPGACSGSCATISSSSASSQGAAAANDAVAHAQALGIPAGNPIYDDMEQYSRSSSATAEVLAYLSGWTTQLHADGYLSGVYSSASSGITDLVQAYGTGYAEPDDIWIAHWNNQQTTSDPYVPSGDWPGAKRIHQYDGAHNETYGGVTINIDGDYLNSDTATSGNTSPIADGAFVEVSGDSNVYRVVGGAPMLVASWSGFGGPQPVQIITAQQFSQLAPYPHNGTFLNDTNNVSYRVAGGTVFPVSTWSIYGGPQPMVTIDAFDVQIVGNPLVHLAPAPVNGTIVEGLPSRTYWTFTNGRRSKVPATPAAVGVDDWALKAFPVARGTGGVGPHKTASSCVAPQLKHMSLVRARAALRRGNCRLGRVRRPRHWGRHHLLRVFGQSTRPRSKHPSGFRINIRLL
ncbi:MAG: DUF1906 domain-containing protein [Solirubrobacteraceae bacterium]